MVTSTITWRDGQIEQFTGLGSFKTIASLVKHYTLTRQDHCAHSFIVGIKTPKCYLCKKIISTNENK